MASFYVCAEIMLQQIRFRFADSKRCCLLSGAVTQAKITNNNVMVFHKTNGKLQLDVGKKETFAGS